MEIVVTIQSVEVPTRRGSEYAMLSRIVKDAGLLERRKLYYWLRIALNIVLVAAAGFTLYLANHTWWVLLVAMLSRIVKDAGLLERRNLYYWLRIALNIVLVAAAGFTILDSI